jgi:hypothetical protein
LAFSEFGGKGEVLHMKKTKLFSVIGVNTLVLFSMFWGSGSGVRDLGSGLSIDIAAECRVVF